MAKQYKIRAGFSFIDNKAGVLAGGEIVTLEDDVAALHLHKLEDVPEPPAPAKKPAAKAKVTADEEKAPAAEPVQTSAQPDAPAVPAVAEQPAADSPATDAPV